MEANYYLPIGVRHPKWVGGLPTNRWAQSMISGVRRRFQRCVAFLDSHTHLCFKSHGVSLLTALCFCSRRGAGRAPCWLQHLCRGSAERVTLPQAFRQQLPWGPLESHFLFSLFFRWSIFACDPYRKNFEWQLESEAKLVATVYL